MAKARKVPLGSGGAAKAKKAITSRRRSIDDIVNKATGATPKKRKPAKY